MRANKINEQLKKIKEESRMGLMTHIVAGYPDLETSKRLVIEMEKAGVDFVEIQIPFSDPLADGPTIMEANRTSLENGTKVKDVFRIAKELSKEVNIPLIFMTYFNIAFNYGVEKFCQDAAKAGISGFIIPDMPLDEEPSEKLNKYSKINNLINIKLLSPASTKNRIEKNAKEAEGFLYYVSRKGTTGAKTDFQKNLNKELRNLKKYFQIPIAVGFGISSKTHLDRLKGNADIAVVGSEVINRLNIEGIKGAINFVKSLI